MPSALACFGVGTWTGWPSKRYSPLSNAWIPAIPLIRVLLPAPLSPTSAVTWPSRAVRLDVVQDLDGPEALVDAAQLEQRPFGC